MNYLIAVNMIDPSCSRLLLKTAATVISDDVLAAELSASSSVDFFGKGYQLYLCEKIPLIEDTLELDCFNLNLDGKLCSYEVLCSVKSYPRIEGDFVPGIYCFFEGSPYYEIRDVQTLSAIYIRECEGEFNIAKDKLVCSSEGIEWRMIETNQLYVRSNRLPFTYFDIHCPLCNQKVMTAEIDQNDSRKPLRFLNIPCPHFVGHGLMVYGIWDEHSLDAFPFDYTIQNDELYFKISGRWQKAIVYSPPSDSANSFYNGGFIKNDYGDHVFFVDPKEDVSVYELEITFNFQDKCP